MRPDVEAIERATFDAVAPAEVVEIGGWLAGLEAGSIRRAKSAVPLRHDLACDEAVIDQIEAAYRLRELGPAFRIADEKGLADLRQALSGRGYAAEQPTMVEVGTVTGILTAGFGCAGEVITEPDHAWSAVFLGDGFDPVDGAYRVASLSRSSCKVFGQVREDGETVAVGVAGFGRGWASLHGMRTAKSHRGRGHAGQVMTALAKVMAERGAVRVFLQVEEPNAAARGLYRRAGFSPAWRYHYWSGRSL